MQEDQLHPEIEDSRQNLVNILTDIAKEEETALTQLYDLTSAKLFGICIYICGDKTAAEDILQEVYLKIWHRAAQYQDNGNSPISWLAVIARNTAIDWCRKNGNEPKGDDAVMEIIADDAPLADKAIESREQGERILDCLEQIGEQQSAHIRSAFFGGNTYEALAKKSGVPLSTIKSRIRRGLQRLRKCIENG